MKLTKGSILSYSSRSIDQLDLFIFGLDGGYLEHFQYILLFWCFILSSLIWIKSKEPVISMPIIYFFLFIDDALNLHDIGYNAIISHVTNSFTLNQEIMRIKDFAEISYWLFALIIVFLISTKGYLHASSTGRRFLKGNYYLFLSMAIFGKFFDLVSSNIITWISLIGFQGNNAYHLKIVFSLIEEIGELGVISLAVLWLFNVACESLSPQPMRWGRLFTHKICKEKS